jgi:hypothetical protein
MLSEIHFMRKYCDLEENELKFLRDLHAFSTPECERVVFGMPSVSVSL